MVTRPLLSPSPRPITPSWPSGDLGTDGTDKMRLSAYLKPTGRETCWWGYYRFHTPQGLLSVKCHCLSAHFSLMFYHLHLFFSVLSFDWPYLPLFPFPSLFNNNPLSYFILLVMMSSSIMALCSLSDLSDDSLSCPTFFFLSFPPSVSTVQPCWSVLVLFKLLFVSLFGGAAQCHCLFGVRVTH